MGKRLFRVTRLTNGLFDGYAEFVLINGKAFKYDLIEEPYDYFNNRSHRVEIVPCSLSDINMMEDLTTTRRTFTEWYEFTPAKSSKGYWYSHIPYATRVAHLYLLRDEERKKLSLILGSIRRL